MALCFHIGVSMMATSLGSYFYVFSYMHEYVGIEVVESSYSNRIASA